MLVNQICMYTTRKSYPIVGELASSPIEGRVAGKKLKFVLLDVSR